MGVMSGYGKCLVILIVIFIPLSVFGEGPLDKESLDKAPALNSAEAMDKTAYEEPAEENLIADPLEPWNRFVFALNDGFYFTLIKPVARVYSFITPEWGRVRVRSVFQNLGAPGRFVSTLLQGNMKGAGNELLRFVLNTTIGIGGMFDVAQQNFKIKSSDEDLGLTLGHYGIGEGFFIVWPFLGPSSARDSVGMAGDSFLYPLSYITPFKDLLAVRFFEFENDVSLRIGEYEDLRESSLDPYVAMKDAFSEYRRNKVRKGATEKDRSDAVPTTGWPGH
jgi:phospholipid-binding lipoprotein MlaA